MQNLVSHLHHPQKVAFTHFTFFSTKRYKYIHNFLTKKCIPSRIATFCCFSERHETWHDDDVDDVFKLVSNAFRLLLGCKGLLIKTRVLKVGYTEHHKYKVKSCRILCCHTIIMYCINSLHEAKIQAVFLESCIVRSLEKAKTEFWTHCAQERWSCFVHSLFTYPINRSIFRCARFQPVHELLLRSHCGN